MPNKFGLHDIAERKLICSAQGCENRATVSVGTYEGFPDMNLCNSCLSDLRDILNLSAPYFQDEFDMDKKKTVRMGRARLIFKGTDHNGRTAHRTVTMLLPFWMIAGTEYWKNPSIEGIEFPLSVTEGRADE